MAQPEAVQGNKPFSTLMPYALLRSRSNPPRLVRCRLGRRSLQCKKYFLRYTQTMSTSRKIPAIFYRSASGSEPVREWLKTLDKADRQTVGEDIAYVQYKWPIGKPRVDHLRGPIWEVRSKIGNRIARMLFAVEESEMILLHAFVKKTQQTNPADIELATKRLKEWINGQSK